MKNILTSLMIFLFIISNITIVNSDFESERIWYLIRYVDTKINDLEKISKKYNLENDKDINSRIKKLVEINNILIKTEKTWEYNRYISKLIEQLKDNNNLIKSQLKVKISNSRIEADKYSILYYKKIKPFTKKINKIIIDIARKLMTKDRLSNKDKQIVWILILIKQKLSDLENITERKWNSKKEVRDYIASSFKQITYNFKQIKNITKKSR